MTKKMLLVLPLLLASVLVAKADKIERHPCAKFAHGSYPTGAGALDGFPALLAGLSVNMTWDVPAAFALKFVDDIAQTEAAAYLASDDVISKVITTTSNRFVILATAVSVAVYGTKQGWTPEEIRKAVLKTIYALYGTSLALTTVSTPEYNYDVDAQI